MHTRLLQGNLTTLNSEILKEDGYGNFKRKSKEEPMHYGEVFGTWAFLTTTKGLIACHQTMRNHTGDKDLYKLLVEVINQGKQESDHHHMKGLNQI